VFRATQKRSVTTHSPDVVAASDSELGYGNTLLVAKAMALTGIDLIADPVFLADVKAEFERSRAVRQATK